MELIKYNLEDIAFDFSYGSMPDDKDICDDGYPIFSGYRVVGYSKKYNIQKRSLVVVARGVGGTGNVEIAEAKTFLTNLSIAISVNENIANIDYLKNYLNIQGLRYLDSGAAQSQITIQNLRHHKVFIPSLNIQTKIASILLNYEYLIEINNKRIKVLEQMAENLYKEWFVRFRFPGHETAEFENGVPKGWKYRTLGEISLIEMGQSPESQYYNFESNGLPFHQGVGSYGEYYLIDDMYSSQGARIAEPNSIIFSVRAPVGRINLTINRIILGRGVAAINSKAGKNWFLLYMLKNRFTTDDIIGNGSIFSSVKKDDLLKQKFLIPSFPLLTMFDSVAKKIENQIRYAYFSNNNLTRQRDLLLPRLMSGKLEV